MVIGVGHMQVDWLWETPATGLLVMCDLRARAGRPATAGRARCACRCASLSLGLAIAVGVIGILPALLAERYTDASYHATPDAPRSGWPSAAPR